ncbi:hypothetical protein EGW08_009548 [Elysia chlorotica]|uniref:Peptidase S1 domain-containing protein n=1 Tax=Elysia chlorotica TaxID=188477 RepID=A0A3S0ZPH3_ELYCH|nr:hypothetical protein EGW08_009548 [Elysia chlorotica]
MAQSYVHPDGGQHECEILGSGPESEESESNWKACEKNPGHEDFISAQDFIDNYMTRVKTDKLRDRLKAMLDLTVRLRVNWTSPSRPDGYIFSHARGRDKLRLGSGLIWGVKDPVSNKPCLCSGCDGKTGIKSWKFKVRTARHVVYDTEEATKTKVDLFYDGYSCKAGDRMVTLRGLEVVRSDPDMDCCYMLCVSHDEALAERIKSASCCLWDRLDENPDLHASDLDFLLSGGRGADHALIVSHPHGQPKKISLGELRDGEPHHAEYNAATCPGSSGASVFRFVTGRVYVSWFLPIHSGSFSTPYTQQPHQLSLLTRFLNKLRGREVRLDQCNYGNWWLL